MKASKYFVLNQVCYIVLAIITLLISREVSHQTTEAIIVVGEPIVLVFTYMIYRDTKRRNEA